MRILFYFLFLVIIIIGVIFAYLNASPVLFSYYFGSQTIPLSLLLVLSFGVGIILCFLWMLIPLLKLKYRNRKLKNQVKKEERIDVETLHATSCAGEKIK